MKSIFCASLFTLALAFGSAQAGKIATVDSFGLQIELPDGWTELNANQFYANLGHIETKDPKFQELLKKHANVPVVMVAKYPEPYDSLNPSLKVNVRPYGQIKSRSAVELTGVLLKAVSNLFEDIEVLSTPSEKIIGGRKVGHVTISYTLKTELKDFRATSELWVVPLENYFIMVGSGYDGVQQQEAAKEIERAVSTLRISID